MLLFDKFHIYISNFISTPPPPQGPAPSEQRDHCRAVRMAEGTNKQQMQLPSDNVAFFKDVTHPRIWACSHRLRRMENVLKNLP